MCWSPPTRKTEPSGRVKGTKGRGFALKNGERAAKLNRWTRMPVHPESAMRGEDRACGERHEGDTDKSEECTSCDVEHSRLKEKAWGVVIGRPKVSRGYGGGITGSSLSSSSESEDSDCRLENGLGEAKRDDSVGSKCKGGQSCAGCCTRKIGGS